MNGMKRTKLHARAQRADRRLAVDGTRQREFWWVAESALNAAHH